MGFGVLGVNGSGLIMDMSNGFVPIYNVLFYVEIMEVLCAKVVPDHEQVEN